MESTDLKELAYELTVSQLEERIKQLELENKSCRIRINILTETVKRLSETIVRMCMRK